MLFNQDISQVNIASDKSCDMASTSSSTRITASCACKTFGLEVTIPSSSLPHELAFCLCNCCRTLTGSIGTSYLPVPASQTIDPDSYSLTAYGSSYFCSTCGAHVLLGGEGRWALATGLLDRTDGILKWKGCKSIEDTLDGGISVWLKSITDSDGSTRELQRWLKQDEDGRGVVSAEPFRKRSSLKHTRVGEDRLNAQCHCGGVKFYVTRPNAVSKAARSAFPDLMVPYYGKEPSENFENRTWWLCGGDTKYLAGTCTCSSCRAALGFEIQPWAFIPRCNLFCDDGREMDFELGTLKRYASSKDVSREFCSVCGATAFWHCEWRPDLVDVSVGLLDPKQGARVESWLEWWTERVSFEELAVNRSLVRSLEEGLKGPGCVGAAIY